MKLNTHRPPLPPVSVHRRDVKKKKSSLDFLDFLLVLTITLTRFSLIPAMGDIAVAMSQGHRICVRVFCLQNS